MPLILTGLGKTVQLAGIISVTGLLLGIVVFYLSLSRSGVVRRLVQGYISFFVGMPLIVLLFLMYYGLPQWGVRFSSLAVAVFGFTLNVAAYNAAYMTTAFNGLDQAELEAASAQGFTHRQIFTLITLPQVLRLSIHPHQPDHRQREGQLGGLPDPVHRVLCPDPGACRHRLLVFLGLSPGDAGLPRPGLHNRAGGPQARKTRGHPRPARLGRRGRATFRL